MANTTSGTVTFDKTFAVDEIIEDAYERIGLQSVSGYQLKTARRTLNILFQEWGASGDGTSATTAGGTSGTSTYGIADVLEATLRSDRGTTSEADSALTKTTRATYSSLANKLAKGTPSRYFVQRLVDKTTVTIYPTPDSSSASKEVHMYFVKRIQDADATYTDATDIPYRFIPSMTSGLAFYLSQKYAPQRSQELKLYYEDELARALSEDGSAASTYITPKNYYPNI